MADHQWIKNLAGAAYNDGIWVLKDPEDSRLSAHNELSDIIPTLHRELEDATHIFNLHAQHEKTMKVIGITPPGKLTQSGLILLFGRHQIKLEKESNKLVQRSITVENFDKIERIVRTFAPHFDSFGSLLWKSQPDLIVTREQLIKILMCDLCRVALTKGKGS